MNTASKTRHVFILFLADIVWGIAFVAQSKGGDAVGAFSFNGIRFLIGALCLLPVIKILDVKELTVNKPESKKQKKELWTKFKTKCPESYKKLRMSIIGGALNLPGKVGRSLTVYGYKICNKVYGFN